MLRLDLRTARPYQARLNTCNLWNTNPNHLYLRRTFISSVPRLKKSRQDSRRNHDVEEEKPKVRWYQQLLPWSTERKRTDGEIGFAGVQYDEAKWLKDQIQKDNAEIRELEGRGGKTLVEPLLATLPKEDAQKIRDAIRQEEIEDAQKERQVKVIKRRLAEILPRKDELEIQWTLAPEQNTYLKTLNEMILKASSDLPNQDLRKKLWQCYARCKAFLPPFLHLIPEKSWNIIWASQQTLSPDDPHWASHTVTLFEDMIKAGKEMGLYQKVLYIEALRAEGRQERAISQWQELEGQFGGDKQASEEHELLGVRLFASDGDPEKAERLALNFLGTEKQEESRILIPILHAWAQRGDDIGIQHAWALYLRFRKHVGSNITMDDYDNITMGFLNVGRTDLALAVFKDMMLTGQQPGQGSMELYQKSLAMMGRTQESAITVADLNKISMTGLVTLPRRFQNKFFYGSWLKKLLGMGEVNAAAQVIELMYERGVKPDPKHLNGIVGAWLRTGTDKDREAAEKMAWAMIHERLDFVSMRRRGLEPRTSKLPTVSGLPIPVHLRRSVAPANIETFSLLLRHYGRRAQDDNIQLIRNTLEMAEIKPNTYFINHLLYIDLRRGQHQAAWIKYKDIFGKLKPDLETFACLWDCEKAHIDSLTLHARDKFPGPRRIMYEMMTWFSGLSSTRGAREAVQEEFSKELYNQIIRCMGLASDLEGTIVALYALRQSFGFYPDDNTTRMVNLSVSRMKLGVHKDTKGRQRGKNIRKVNANRIAQVYGIVVQQREIELAEHGLDDLAQIDDDIQREESLFRVAEFLRTVLRRTGGDEGEEKVEGNVEKAAWEMGVGGVRIEDPKATYGKYREMYRLGDATS